jgi:5'-nucleotidase
MFGRLGVFGEPFDLVVAGINPGANAGRAIYHSGTVGAALTARNGGVSGLAVSQAVEDFGVEGQGWDDMLADQQWDTAAEVGARVARTMLADLPTDPIVVNVNVPNRPLDKLAGWRRTEVALMPPRALAGAELIPKVGHDGTFDVHMKWGDPLLLPADTDSGAVEAGYVAITALCRMTDDDTVDLARVTAALDEM